MRNVLQLRSGENELKIMIQRQRLPGNFRAIFRLEALATQAIKYPKT